MNTIRAMLKQAKLMVFENIYSKKININIDKAIFSFTFDDVPISAATHGAKILEAANATGTYYVALGMVKNASDKKKYIDENDIKALHQNGHNIACHTYSHLNLRQNSTADILQDCEMNTKMLTAIIQNEAIEHFAYPFGAVSLHGKKALGSKYKTLRTTDHGINVGSTDLTHLRTVSLCARDFSRETIRQAIEEAVNLKAWIIFFTHDIRENPSDWGSTIDDFAWVVDQCAKSSGDILNVSSAYNSIIQKHLI